MPPIRISPELISSSPAIMRSAVVLPQPGRADEHDELALGDLEVEVADRDDVVAVDLGEVDELDLRPLATHRPGSQPECDPPLHEQEEDDDRDARRASRPPSAGPSPFRAAS